MLQRIAQYVEWPGHAEFGDDSKPIVVAVLGDNPFGNTLDQVYAPGGQTIKGKTVSIRYCSKVNQIEPCHILFISRSEKDKLGDILLRIKDKPILSFADTEHFGQAGVHINFYMTRNKVRFELNESSVRAAGLKVDFRLRSIAKIVTPNGG